MLAGVGGVARAGVGVAGDGLGLAACTEVRPSTTFPVTSAPGLSLKRVSPVHLSVSLRFGVSEFLQLSLVSVVWPLQWTSVSLSSSRRVKSMIDGVDLARSGVKNSKRGRRLCTQTSDWPSSRK